MSTLLTTIFWLLTLPLGLPPVPEPIPPAPVPIETPTPEPLPAPVSVRIYIPWLEGTQEVYLISYVTAEGFE